MGFASWDSVKLPIYFCPVKVKLKPSSNGADGNDTPLSPRFKIYDSYEIGYYEGGVWRTVRASTLEKAKTKGKLIAKRLAENGSQALRLSQEECRVYVNAKNLLQTHNLQVDAAARLVDDLLRRLNGASLQQAVDFFNAHGKRVVAGAKTTAAYDVYIEDLKRRLINTKVGYINVTDAVAKVNQRAVPIFENLKRRLAAYPETEKRDKVSKRWGSSNSLYHVWKRVIDKAGLPYKKNAFRNSYISYRLAQTKDINLVAYESGNSPEMIRKYYLDLATPEQAAAWFSL